MSSGPGTFAGGAAPLAPGDLLEQSQWDFFWVPGDVEVVDRPELLYIRCKRDVPVLNTATRTRAAASALPPLIQEVRGAHSGVRSRWLVRNLQRSEPLQGALADAGYSPQVLTHEMVLETRGHRPRPTSRFAVRPVATRSQLVDCMAVIDRAFPGGRSFTEDEVRRDLKACTGAAARVRRVVVYDSDSGQPVASGGMTLFPQLRFGLLWAGGTVPAARGTGAYSAALAARVMIARELGYTHVGLYAIADTSAPIVARQGFARHGTMTYWEHLA